MICIFVVCVCVLNAMRVCAGQYACAMCLRIPMFVWVGVYGVHIACVWAYLHVYVFSGVHVCVG